VSSYLRSDNLLRIVASLFLAFLVYQAKTLCDRVQRVEDRTIRICTRLGIDPVTGDTPGKWGFGGTVLGVSGNQRNQTSPEDP
jgi:hypothetical protein